MLYSPTVSHVRFVFVRRTFAVLLLSSIGLLASPPIASSQERGPAGDTNILLPVKEIEKRLLAELEVVDVDRARPLEEDRSRRVTIAGPDDAPPMVAHWKPVAAPGDGFNNEPRYELAAYRFQQLFLDEPDYVVPPVVLRTMPIEEYRQIRSVRGPTIRGTQSVLFMLSYWVQNLAVDTVDPFDQQLFDQDENYRRHFANTNLLTHLIDHKDGNHGNVLVSMDGVNRRVFSVDNDVAFRSRLSDQGDRWRNLHVDRLPAESIERLRTITRERLQEALGVVAEFEIVDGLLSPVEPGPNLRANRGLRVQDGRVQFGLTEAEVRDLERKIERLLRDVDRGRLSTF